MVTNIPNDGHPPSPGWSSTIPRTVIHYSKDGHPQFQGGSPSISRMVLHHPKDSHPPSHWCKLTILRWSSTIHSTVINISRPNKKWSLTVAQTCLFCNEVLLSQSGTTCSKIQCVIFQDFSWQIDFHNHFTISNYAKKQVQSQALGEPDLFIAISSSFQFKNINIHKVLE